LDRAGWQRIEDRIFNPGRVVLYAGGLLLCYAIFLATGYFDKLWLFDDQGRGRAIDFVAAWAAAQFATSGEAATAYDLGAFTKEQLTAVASLGGDYAWAYPPTYFLLIAPLALFSYVSGALAWMFGTLVLYGAGIRAILPRWSAVLAAMASPFALWSFYSGQNGFLTAALIAGTLALLDRRPIAAGILLGLLTVKPQLGIVFPVILILTGRWRVFTAAAVTALLLALLSYLLFGPQTWSAFFGALQHQAGSVLDRGEVAFHKQQSVHALLRLLGAGDTLAWSVHAAVALTALGFTLWLWMQRVDDRLKAAALAMTALLATPYLFIYDLPILSVPIAFLCSLGIDRGFIPGERTAIAVLMPVLLLFAGAPVGVPLLLALWLLIVLRLRRERLA
jgi:arabinofuranan 3-O-arabinosyltransferase